MSSLIDKSFSRATGEPTEEERQYKLRKGLLLEDSNGEFFDISTDVEDLGSSRSTNGSFVNESMRDSLSLFEENERLFKTPDRKMSGARKLNLSTLPINNDNEDGDNFDEENKENELRQEDYVKLMPQEVFLENSDDRSDSSFTKKSCEVSLDEYDIDIVSCTQNLAPDYDSSVYSYSNENDDIDIVPCTQYQDLASDCDSSACSNENEEIVACTQAENLSDGSMVVNDSMEIVSATQKVNDSQNVSQMDISSVPCSQPSVAGSCEEDLDDTLTTMTKLLALADEQEVNEKMASKPEKLDEPSQNVENQEKAKPSESSNNPVFKTPLKHARVQLLKNRKLCTPSPPRSYANSILQRGAKNKQLASTVPTKQNARNGPEVPEFATCSTPKRIPLLNITPSKVTSTPRNVKTPVTSKVDSGLRRSPFQIGLSPVANYIHAKPPPSTFTRVQGIPKSTPINLSRNNLLSRKPSLSGIPITPRFSQAQIKPPQTAMANSPSASRSSLKTVTYFDMNSTPPKIVKNSRFTPLKYTGTSKVKTINGKIESPREDFVAHRHTGLRDESGNASFIQNTFVKKTYIPHQSRLATPPAYTRRK